MASDNLQPYTPGATPLLEGGDVRYLQNELRKISAAIASIRNVLVGWTAYTPTVTALTGTFTTVSATGRYKQVGSTVFFNIQISITTNGTAAGFVTATLPMHAPQGLVANGISVGLGFALCCAGPAAGVTVNTLKYDGTYPGSTGDTLAINGFYEV